MTDTGWLAADLHRAIDEYVAVANRFQHLEGRSTHMKSAMFDWLSARLDEHGYTGDRDERHRLLDADIDLNVQGLEVWLQRRAKAKKK